MYKFIPSNTTIDRSSKSIKSYLREIKKYPLISAEEEAELAQIIRKGGKDAEEAKTRLVKANLRFVVSVANKYKRNDMELIDLISEGNMGLMKAAELFDERKGFKFISYAINWIRQSILDAMANTGDIIRVPQNQQRLMERYKRYSREMMQDEQRLPTPEEFASYAGIDVAAAKQISGSFYEVVSMEEPISCDDPHSKTIGDFQESDSRADSWEEANSMHDEVNNMIKELLPARESEVIRRYFGIGCEMQSLEAIGKEIGLSRERTRQVKEKGLSILRSSEHIQEFKCYLIAG